MAALFIEADSTKAPVRSLLQAFTRLREGRDQLRNAVRALESFKDGDGSQDSHWQRAVDEGLYPTTTDARLSYAESSSLLGKINTMSGQQTEAVGEAILQCPALHGI
jgi:hypothetical protein